MSAQMNRSVNPQMQQVSSAGTPYSAKNSFIYQPPSPTSIAPGNSVTLSFNVDGDSDFFWTKLTAYADVTNTGVTYSTQILPGITLLITNNTSGRNYMSAAVPAANIAGTAQFPFILPQVTFIPAKASIQIQALNITAGETYTSLYLSFIGIKAFL